MTKISQYSTDVNITGNDKWIGSDAQNFLITKNFTPNNLASFFNENNVIDIGTSIRYRYQTLLPGEAREQGTISFETEIGPQVNFSAITTFLIAKNTLKGNTVTQYLDFLVDSKVLLSKASNINVFGYYKITSIEPWIPNTNFFVVEVDFLTGNGFISEDLDYLVSLVDKVQDIPPPVWGSITGDIEDQTDLIDYIASQVTTPTLQSVLTAGREFDETTDINSIEIKEGTFSIPFDSYEIRETIQSIDGDAIARLLSIKRKEIAVQDVLIQDVDSNYEQTQIRVETSGASPQVNIFSNEKYNSFTDKTSGLSISSETLDADLETITKYIFKQKAVTGDYEVATTDDITTPTLQEVMETGRSYQQTIGDYDYNFGFDLIGNLFSLFVINNVNGNENYFVIQDSKIITGGANFVTGGEIKQEYDIDNNLLTTSSFGVNQVTQYIGGNGSNGYQIEIGNASGGNTFFIPCKTGSNSGGSLFGVPNNKPAGTYTLAITDDIQSVGFEQNFLLMGS
jgi:hypothetical protein